MGMSFLLSAQPKTTWHDSIINLITKLNTKDCISFNKAVFYNGNEMAWMAIINKPLRYTIDDGKTRHTKPICLHGQRTRVGPDCKS